MEPIRTEFYMEKGTSPSLAACLAICPLGFSDKHILVVVVIIIVERG